MNSRIGPWRDATYLVFHSDGELPNRCVFTNEAIDERRPLELYVLPLGHLVTLLLLPLGLLLYVSRKVPVELCVASEAWNAYRKRQRKGWLITMCSFVSACLLTVAYGLALNGVISVPPSIPPVILTLLVASVVGIPCGLLYRGYSVFSSLHVRRTKRDYVWLANVSEDLLKDLPDWDPQILTTG